MTAIPADEAGRESEANLDEIIRQKLIERAAQALTEAGANSCPVCGGPVLPHDDAACAAKAAACAPMGFVWRGRS